MYGMCLFIHWRIQYTSPLISAGLTTFYNEPIGVVANKYQSCA